MVFRQLRVARRKNSWGAMLRKKIPPHMSRDVMRIFGISDQVCHLMADFVRRESVRNTCLRGAHQKALAHGVLESICRAGEPPGKPKFRNFQ